MVAFTAAFLFVHFTRSINFTISVHVHVCLKIPQFNNVSGSAVAQW